MVHVGQYNLINHSTETESMNNQVREVEPITDPRVQNPRSHYLSLSLRGSALSFSGSRPPLMRNLFEGTSGISRGSILDNITRG